VSAVRIHVAFAPMAYLSLVWFAHYRTGTVPRWLLWVATVASVLVVVWNGLTPQTLLFDAVLEVQGVLLPWGEVIVQAVAIPATSSHVVELLTFALYGVFAYAWWGHADGGDSSATFPIAIGMALLLATMVVEAADPRVVPMLPADEFGLVILQLVQTSVSRQEPTRR
jgi:hypothetical protein